MGTTSFFSGQSLRSRHKNCPGWADLGRWPSSLCAKRGFPVAFEDFFSSWADTGLLPTRDLEKIWADHATRVWDTYRFTKTEQQSRTTPYGVLPLGLPSGWQTKTYLSYTQRCVLRNERPTGSQWIQTGLPSEVLQLQGRSISQRKGRKTQLKDAQGSSLQQINRSPGNINCGVVVAVAGGKVREVDPTRKPAVTVARHHPNVLPQPPYSSSD